MEKVLRTCRDLGFRTPLQPYISTALGASEVRLLELAGAYRAMASGVRAEPHVIARVTDSTGALLYEAPGAAGEIPSGSLALIQEGLRGVVRLPGGTAHALSGSEFPIPVMGKTGTTSEFRDALFVGSTYGPQGITVAVRIGFDDNRTLGPKETGGRTALPDLSRDHGACLQGCPGRDGPAVPPGDGGPDRRVPRAARASVRSDGSRPNNRLGPLLPRRLQW